MTRDDFDAGAVRPVGEPSSARLFDPNDEGPWRGSMAGTALGAPVTVLAYGSDRAGEGPIFTCTPYDEVFVVTEGRGRFIVGDAIIDASAGQVVFGPAGIPHRFENLGPGRLQTIDIHHLSSWIQIDLD